MNDLTIIFITLNKVPEKWAAYQRDLILKESRGCPIITISRLPLDWGYNLLQDPPYDNNNVVKQILRGAKLADTPYVAVAEDDVLYSHAHFKTRPRRHWVLYNGARWQIQTWRPSVFYMKLRLANSALIAPTKLLIWTYEERYAKYPDGLPHEFCAEIGRREADMGISPIQVQEFYDGVGIVHFQHPFSYDPLEQTKRKRLGPLRAIELPHWGRAEDVGKLFC